MRGRAARERMCIWGLHALRSACACADAAMRVSRPQGSTPFLHLCAALFKLGLDRSLLYKASALALLLLFFATRVVASPLCLASLWRHRALWAAGGADRSALFGLCFAVCAFFVALNYFWFAKLLQRALRGAAKPKPKAKKAA